MGSGVDRSTWRGISRRGFLRLSAAAGAGLASSALLAACSPSPPPAPTAKPAAPAPAATAAPPAAAATTAPASTTAAAPTAAPAVQAAGKELTVGLSGDFSTFDPAFTVQSIDVTISTNIYDTLTVRLADLKLAPRLATEWNLVNPTTWQFKLRQGVKFHNGDPLTSKDVKFTIERTYDPAAKTLVPTAFATVDRIETPDDYTVTFITKQPDPLLPARFSVLGGQIVPMEYLKKVGPDEFKVKPIGSGPLKLTEWVKGDYTLLTRFDDYWGEKVPFQTVRVKPLPEVASRVSALSKGEVDIVKAVTPDSVEGINRSGRARVESVPYMGMYVLAVNSNVPPLDKPLVKQALSWAIDREAIIKSLYRGQGTLLSGGILEGDFAFDPSLPKLGHDKARARDLLQQAGYKGEEIILESSTNILNEQLLAEAIVQMWKEVGVNARQELIELSVRAQHYTNRDFKGLWLADPTNFLLDPDGMMWRLLGPKGLFDYWRHPEFDQLGDEARFSTDDNLRTANYKRMNEIFREHLPWIPVMQPLELYGVANHLEWKPFGNHFMDFRGFNLKLKA